MYILAIETTGPVGTVGVIKTEEPGSPVPVKVTTNKMSHLKNLMAMTEDLFREQEIRPEAIDAVAVSAGPGSFTGIRIGVSTGRALAQVWNVPCVRVPTLMEFRLLAGTGAGGEDAEGGDAASDGSVLAVLNARRGQVYGALFSAPGEDGSGKTLIEPGPYMLADVLDRTEALGVKPVVYGDGIDAYENDAALGARLKRYAFAQAGTRYQDARLTAAYAQILFAKGETCGYEELLPDYMRESEAEQRLKDGSLEKMRKARLERLMNSGV